jgi:hypothetical protein
MSHPNSLEDISGWLKASISGWRLVAMRTMFQNKVLPYQEGELGYLFWWLHSSVD